MLEPSLVLALVFAVATSAYMKRNYAYNNLMTYSMLLLMSALVLAIIPPPGIAVQLPEGYLVISLPIILEMAGVILAVIALTPALGLKKTIALITIIYILAVVADAIIYYGELTQQTILSSMIANTIVYIPALIATTITARKYKIS